MAFMRLAYGVMRDDPAEVGAALGYWSAMYLSLGSPTGAAPVTDDPGEVLLRLQPVEAFRHVEAEMDLLWHFMRAMAAKPEFSRSSTGSRIGPDTIAARSPRPRSRSTPAPWISAPCTR